MASSADRRPTRPYQHQRTCTQRGAIPDTACHVSEAHTEEKEKPDIFKGRPSSLVAWTEKHRQMYERDTRHPFTVSIREGTVDMSAFKRWLVSLSPSISPIN